jgi:hypothetical protein
MARGNVVWQALIIIKDGVADITTHEVNFANNGRISLNVEILRSRPT